MELNEQQKRIIRTRDRPLLVDAGAGSGKTTLIVETLAYELGFTAVDGERVEDPLELDEVAAITFTRKAAGQLKEKLREKVMELAAACTGLERERWVARSFAVDEARIGTIDAFAGRVIREYGHLAGVETGYEIIEPGDAALLQREVAESALQEGVREGREGARFLVLHYGYDRAAEILQDEVLCKADRFIQVVHSVAGETDWEALGVNPNLADRLLEPRRQQVLAFLQWAYSLYTDRLEQEGALDHTHVLLRACELARSEAVQAAYRSQTRLLLVDEHQDTSFLQLALVFRLAGMPGYEGLPDGVEPPNLTLPDGRPALRLVVVGDPKQSIYGWRGADVEAWERSRRVIERAGGECLPLDICYRSHPALLRFVDDCLGGIMGSEEERRAAYDIPFHLLVAARPETDGPAVEVLVAEGSRDKADASREVASMVAERITEILADPDEHRVWERQMDGTEQSRPVRPGDLAILARSLRWSADDYAQELRARGVDCHVYAASRLYGRREIQDLSICLRAVADPHNPVALTAFLRSALGGVDDVTLAELAAASTAAPRRRRRGTSLYDALCSPEGHVSAEEGVRRAQQAAELLQELRDFRERVPHDELLEIAIERSGYRTFLAGAPDAPVGLRNVEKLIRIARRAGREPLSHFVERLAGRVERADPEEEAPLYTPDDDLVTISTIHSAKGLEWPYVFAASLQEKGWKIRDDQPYLNKRLGLVLPLEVAAEEDMPTGPAAQLPAQAALWREHFEEATWREYAEAKRLMYVMCTRARDRLFLAGCPDRYRNGTIVRPRRLETQETERLHYHCPMRWLQYLYPEPLCAPEEGGELMYPREVDGRDPDAARVRFFPRIPNLTPEEAEEAGIELPARRRAWPQPVFGTLETVREEWDAELLERMGSLEQRTALRRAYTPTEIMTYDRCPQRHLLRYRHSISRPEIEVRSDVPVVEQIPPAIRGRLLHEFFARYNESWDEDRKRREMERVFLRHYPMAQATAEENALALLLQADNFLASELYGRVRAADEERREVPFFYRLDGETGVPGVIDWMVREDDSWLILDLKAGLVDQANGGPSDEELRVRAARYRTQAGLYVIATEAALGEGSVREFDFFFTDVGRSWPIAVTDAWLEEQRTRVEEIARSIRNGDYGGRFCEPEVRCRGCDYWRRSAA